MTIQSGKIWFELLPAAVFKMNSNYKRSIRATPYRIMFGRESPYINLLQLIQFDSVEEEFTSSEEELSEAEERDNLTDFDVSNFETKERYHGI